MNLYCQLAIAAAPFVDPQFSYACSCTTFWHFVEQLIKTKANHKRDGEKGEKGRERPPNKAIFQFLSYSIIIPCPLMDVARGDDDEVEDDYRRASAYL